MKPRPALAALLIAGLVASCDQRSATKIAEQTTALCGTDLSFGQLLADSFARTEAEERPAAGSNTRNVTFHAMHPVVNVPLEISVKVADREAVGFSGSIGYFSGPKELTAADLDAFCAGELATEVLSGVVDETMRILAGASLLKLEFALYRAQHGKPPSSLADLNLDRPMGAQRNEALAGTRYSLAAGGAIVIDLPDYIFREADAPQLRLTPDPNDESSIRWNCTSNLEGDNLEAIPWQCRRPAG